MHTTLALALLSTSLAAAKDKPTITFKPPAADEDSRPVATELYVSPDGSDYLVRAEFDREPFGESCKNRCANATVFLDTDNNKSSGLQLLSGGPENGADLAVSIQGTREFKEESSVLMLKVKVRYLRDGLTNLDEGNVLAELDQKRDAERVKVEGNTVSLRIDATDGMIPSGKQMRVVYHPPESKALVGSAKGLLAGGSGRVDVYKKGKHTTPKKSP